MKHTQKALCSTMKSPSAASLIVLSLTLIVTGQNIVISIVVMVHNSPKFNTRYLTMQSTVGHNPQSFIAVTLHQYRDINPKVYSTLSCMVSTKGHKPQRILHVFLHAIHVKT